MHLGYEHGKYLFSVYDAVSAFIRGCLILQLLVLHFVLLSYWHDSCCPVFSQFIVLFVSSYRSLSLLYKYLLPSMHTFLLLPPLSLHGFASVKSGAQVCSSIDAEFNRFSMILNKFFKRHYQNNIQCVTHLWSILFFSMNIYSKY